MIEVIDENTNLQLGTGLIPTNSNPRASSRTGPAMHSYRSARVRRPSFHNVDPAHNLLGARACIGRKSV